MGRRSGISADKLAALRDTGCEPRADLFDESERIVLLYADAMTATPVVVPDELFASLRAFLDERQLVELTSAIAWENYRARFDHAFGIDSMGFLGEEAAPDRG